MDQIANISFDSFINNQSIYKETPLHLACYKGSIIMTEILLNAGAKVDIYDRCNNTAIFYAVQSKKLEVVKLLVEAGSNINVKNKWNYTPYIVAKKLNLTDIAEYLRNLPQFNEKDNIEDPNEDESTVKY